MNTKKLSFFANLLYAGMICSCTKETKIIDEVDNYLGRYLVTLSYSYPLMGNGVATDTSTLAKINSKKLVFVFTQGTPNYYNVNGTSLTDAGSNVTYLPDSTGNAVAFKDVSTGIIKNDSIIVTGTWTRQGLPSGSYIIRAKKLL